MLKMLIQLCCKKDSEYLSFLTTRLNSYKHKTITLQCLPLVAQRIVAENGINPNRFYKETDMHHQVSKQDFIKALSELGHNPNDYIGKKLTLEGMSSLYEIEKDAIIDAIDQKFVDAHYNYSEDTIWVDALDAAHFYFCVKSMNEF